MPSLVNRVRELRKISQLTQEDLADAVSVSRQTIIAIEGGDYLPSVYLALKIAKRFQCPVEDVFQLKK